MRKPIQIGLIAAAIATVASVSVAATSGAEAVAARQANFKQLGGAFGGINAELKKDAPDLALIRTNAAKMNALASQEPTWFPAGSGPEAGVKTAAKPEIWSDGKGFAEAIKMLQGQTAKLQQVSEGTDLDALKAQVRATGGACKNCHDQYRQSAQPQG